MTEVANACQPKSSRSFRRLLLRGVCIYAGMGAVTACGTLDPDGLAPRGHSAQGGGKRVEVNGSLASGLRLAQSMRNGGGQEAAIALYQSLIEKHPGDIEPVIGLAESLHEIGRYYDALDFALEAVALRERDSRGHRLAGRASLGLHEPREALAYFDAALARNPDDFEAYNGQGVAHQLLGEPEQAKRAFEAALRRAPDSVPIRSNYALSLALAGDFDQGIPLLGEIASSPLAPPRVRQNLALALALKGDEEGARKVGNMDMSSREFSRNLQYLAGLRGAAVGTEQLAAADQAPDQAPNLAADQAPADPPPHVRSAPREPVGKIEMMEPYTQLASAALAEVDERAPVGPALPRPETPVAVGRIWALENARWLASDAGAVRQDELAAVRQDEVTKVHSPQQTASQPDPLSGDGPTPNSEGLDNLLHYLSDPVVALRDAGASEEELQRAAAPRSLGVVHAQVVIEKSRVRPLAALPEAGAPILAVAHRHDVGKAGGCAESGPHWMGCFVVGAAPREDAFAGPLSQRSATFRALDSCRLCGASELTVKVSTRHVCESCGPDWASQVLEEGLAVRDSLLVIKQSRNIKLKLDRIALARRALERLLPFERRGVATLAIPPSVALRELEAVRQALIRQLFDSLLHEAARLAAAEDGYESAGSCRRTLRVLSAELSGEEETGADEGELIPASLTAQQLACVKALEAKLATRHV